MKKNLYFRNVYKRSDPASTLAVKVFQKLASYPRLLLEVFIRKNFGERYFTFGKAINAAIVIAIIPLLHYFYFEASTYFQYSDVRTQMIGMFSVGYASWYLFIIIFLVIAYKRKLEIARNPSVFDFAKFSLHTGDINPRFYKIKLFGKVPDTRLVETLYEPAFFFFIGIALYLMAQMVGLLLVVSAILYRLSYIGAYRLGDDFVMDKIDEMICNEEIFGSFVEDKDASQTRGVRYYGRKPNDESVRRKLIDSFIEEEEVVEVS